MQTVSEWVSTVKKGRMLVGVSNVSYVQDTVGAVRKYVMDITIDVYNLFLVFVWVRMWAREINVSLRVGGIRVRVGVYSNGDTETNVSG